MLRPSSSAEPRAKAKTPLFKCNDDRDDDDVLWFEKGEAIREEIREIFCFLFFCLFAEEEKMGEIFWSVNFGFRIFSREEDFY